MVWRPRCRIRRLIGLVVVCLIALNLFLEFWAQSEQTQGAQGQRGSTSTSTTGNTLKVGRSKNHLFNRYKHRDGMRAPMGDAMNKPAIDLKPKRKGSVKKIYAPGQNRGKHEVQTKSPKISNKSKQSLDKRKSLKNHTTFKEESYKKAKQFTKEDLYMNVSHLYQKHSPKHSNESHPDLHSRLMLHPKKHINNVNYTQLKYPRGLNVGRNKRDVEKVIEGRQQLDQNPPPIKNEDYGKHNINDVIAAAVNMGEGVDAEKRKEFGENVDKDEALDPKHLDAGLAHIHEKSRPAVKGLLQLKERNKTMSIATQAKTLVRMWKKRRRPTDNFNCSEYNKQSTRPRKVLPFFHSKQGRPMDRDLPMKAIRDEEMRRGASRKDDLDIDADVTLTTQFNLDRLVNFNKIARNWPGPISAAMYVTKEEADRLPDIFARQSHLANRTNIDYHIVLVEGDLYPTNVLRNVAFNYSRTAFIYNTDVDFVTVPQTYQRLKKLAQRGLPRPMEAFVIPAFEIFDPSTKFPRTKEEAKDRIRSLKMLPFHLVNYAPGHLPTKFDKWVNTNKSYEVTYKEDFEPYIMARVDELPQFHAKLVGRYKNKSSHTLAMHKMGFKFIVLANVFTVHLPHLAKRKRLAYDMCAKNVYRQYKDELLLKDYQDNILDNLIKKDRT